MPKNEGGARLISTTGAWAKSASLHALANAVDIEVRICARGSTLECSQLDALIASTGPFDSEKARALAGKTG